MPAAPGARPRKMLPPPITTATSTPMRDTCAISPTIASIVCRLMPYASSPIRASPDSFSMTRLYFGAGISVRGLGLVDSFTNYQEGVSVDLRLLYGQNLLDRLLVVLDEGLPHEGDLAEELVQRTFDHLARDFLRLARFLRTRELNRPLPLNDVRRDIAFRHVLRLGERDVHAEVLADLLRPFIVHQHTDLYSVDVQ